MVEYHLAEAERIVEEVAPEAAEMATETGLDILDHLAAQLDAAVNGTMECLEDTSRWADDWITETIGMGGGTRPGNYLRPGWSDRDLPPGRNVTPYGHEFYMMKTSYGLAVDCRR